MHNEATQRPWTEIEDEFRLWSFHIYYQKSFAAEIDLTLRFAKALIASSQPIRDRQTVIEWFRTHHKERKQHVRTD